MVAAIFAVLLAAGCTSTPEKEASSQTTNEKQGDVKYVELNMRDGTKIGGKYVSESAAFTNIIPMYVINSDGTMSSGNGKESGITTSLIATVVTIEDPSTLINKTLEEQAAAAKAHQAEIDAMNAKVAEANAKAMRS